MNRYDSDYDYRNHDDGVVIDLRELLIYLINKLPLILIAALIGGLIMTAYSYVWYQPKYRTSASIYIVSTGNKETISNSDLQVGNSLTSDYLRIFELKTLEELVKDRLGEEQEMAMQNTEVSPSNPTGTHMIYVTVSSTSPEDAQLVANAYAEATCDFIETYMMVPRPTVIEKASLATEPYSFSKPVLIGLGIVGGALAAMLLGTVLFISDDKIKKSEDISKRLDIPCLGIITYVSPKEERKIRKKRKTINSPNKR